MTVMISICFIVVDVVTIIVVITVVVIAEYCLPGTRIDVPTGRSQRANDELRSTWERARMELTGRQWGTINSTIYKQVQRHLLRLSITSSPENCLASVKSGSTVGTA